MTSKKEFLKELNKSLYVIIDPDFCGEDPVKTALAALKGGAGIFQLRCKGRPYGKTIELARRMSALCAKHGAFFIMNDNPKIAAKVRADGVHLGQDDMPALKARKLFSGIIGVSAYNDKEIRQAIADKVDYFGFGPVFKTSTKKGLPPVKGLLRLARVARKFKELPVVAIGGINEKNIAKVFKAGAASASLITAVCSAGNPEEATRRLMGKIRNSKHEIRNRS